MPADTDNGAYFPIFVDTPAFGMSRDELYEVLMAAGINGRRYFFPAITDTAPYRTEHGPTDEHFPVTASICRQVICLPLFGGLEPETVERIVATILQAGSQ